MTNEQLLVDEELNKVVAYALKLSGTPYWLWDDMRQDAWLGILRSWHRFDPSRGTPFNTYALYAARSAISDGYRRRDLCTRKQRQGIQRGELIPIRPVSMLAAAGVPAPGGTPEREAIAADHVERLLRRLSPRERQVIQATVIDERADTDIGAEMQIGFARVSQIRKKALERLRQIAA